VSLRALLQRLAPRRPEGAHGPTRSAGGGRRGLAPVNLRARVTFVTAALAGGSLLLVARAADLQLVNAEFYQDQGDQRFLREIAIPTPRGMITDRNGEPLAISSPVESVWASPRELLQHPDQVEPLAAALGMPVEPLRQRLEARADREFVYLRRHMNPDQARAILAQGFPGVYSQREFRRFYPLGEVVSHVLGYTNVDDRGQEGLELAYDDWLTGNPGAKRVIRDRRGAIVENVDLIRAPEPGQTLQLSIDRRVQYLAYRELKAALLEHGASSGSVVVLDVATGEVLAMVNQPSYNSNARDGASRDAQRNRAVTDLIEPGSVIKSFTAAAALETGRYTPTTQIETSPGYMPLAGHTVRDVRNFGLLDVTGMLTKSSNIAATKMALDMPREHFHGVLARFGFGASTGSGFPGEAAGQLPAPNRWGILHQATISYGYGLNATPLQLAQAYAALGNGGRMMRPTFVHGQAPEGEQVIDPAIARQVVDMLETVTGPEGTARTAGIRGYRVAGKSGTSRRASAGGYERRYISIFAGLVPASHPRFATVVVINDPSAGAYYGGAVSGPVYHRIMDGTLRLMDVPPDQPEAFAATSASEAARQLEALHAADAVDAAAESVPDDLRGVLE
jgi:cell division protein FtsI (penicillin-binding protein 3)